jgi:hypothetical protein
MPKTLSTPCWCVCRLRCQTAGTVRWYGRVMAAYAERVALNEAAFREGNERMAAWSERHDAPPTERHSYLCECGDTSCDGVIWMTAAEYEAVHADNMRFAVLVGHVFPEAERVVEERDGGRYLVVEKNEKVRAILADKYGPRMS